jgi:hypothetical protein
MMQIAVLWLSIASNVKSAFARVGHDRRAAMIKEIAFQLSKAAGL